MDCVCRRVTDVCNPRWDEAGYLRHEEMERECTPMWRWMWRAWLRKHEERCWACNGRGWVGTDDYREVCFYCGGLGDLIPYWARAHEPEPPKDCAYGGDCLIT